MKTLSLIAALLLSAGSVVAGGLPEALDCDDLATVELEDCPAPIVLGNGSSLLVGGLSGGALAALAAASLLVLVLATGGSTSGTPGT